MEIQELLKQRIEACKNNTLEDQIRKDGKDYHKKYCFAVQCFQKQINKDQLKQKKGQYPFMAIMAKLEHIKEIDDLRWFYKECLKYSRKKGKNFSMCFWGALKIK